MCYTSSGCLCLHHTYHLYLPGKPALLEEGWEELCGLYLLEVCVQPVLPACLPSTCMPACLQNLV